MRKFAAIGIFCLLMGCSEQNESSTEGGASAAIATPTPSHNYALKEGQSYGYQGGISEEDAKAGKVAAEISMFRYLGEKDGQHTIQMLNNNGSPLMKISCAKPCEFMKMDSGERVAYNTSSLGGAVMQDALAGEMEIFNSKEK